MTPAIEKYLEHYAESESRLADLLTGPYQSALVVPVLAEPVAALEGHRAAFAGGQGRGLVILIVNARDDAPQEQHRDNEALLSELAGVPGARLLAASPPTMLVDCPGHDLLVVDRASKGFRLAAKEGVGRARRMGCDIALRLAARGVLRSRGVGCSDADARLPTDYFSAAEKNLPGASAVLFAFRHVASGDAGLDAATQAYELSLRYYVLGLAHAASPYAFHSVGSTLYVDLSRYAAVRGFANRQAGEDFYLLNKIVKTAPIKRLVAPCIELQSRHSSRVPFGTGPGVARLMERRALGDDLRLYAPETFDALAAWLQTMNAFAEDPRRSLASGPMSRLEPAVRRSAWSHLEQIGAARVLAQAADKTRPGPQLRRRLHTWFDAFRTLKFVHAIRDAGFGELPYLQALATAPFLPGTPDSIGAALALATRAEARLPPEVGPGQF